MLGLTVVTLRVEVIVVGLAATVFDRSLNVALTLRTDSSTDLCSSLVSQERDFLDDIILGL